MLAPRLTIVRASWVIALVTLAMVGISGVLMRVVDRQDFPNVWVGLWWATQTVTTVGYGDVVPHTVGGRVIGVIVMLNGIALLTVVIAAVTATFIETARERFERERLIRDPILAELTRIRERLDELERP